MSEIHELLSVRSWRHCPGSDNPADISSQGLTPTELCTSRLWHCGLDWLQIPTDSLAKMKTKERKTYPLFTVNTTVSLESVVQSGKYSSLGHLLLITAYVIKFVQALKQAVKDHHPPCGHLNVD